jgi:hypothetical protein
LIYVNEPGGLEAVCTRSGLNAECDGHGPTQWVAPHGVTLTGAKTPSWYVTVEVRNRGVLPRQRSPRETKTFVTEAEAKDFARMKLEEGLSVFAGTINPHSPKRVVLFSQIHTWLAGEPRDHQQG